MMFDVSRVWWKIIEEARSIAESYSTLVTLRQLHYRLVASGVGGYVNDQSCYVYLSRLTADERRDGNFPPLADLTRSVSRPGSFAGPADAQAWLVDHYRRNRTEGQQCQTWVLYEKATLSAQIQAWTEDYGIPVSALRGYSSESLEREIFEALEEDGRPAVVFYLGDLDPEGEDIERNFLWQATQQGITFSLWKRLAVQPSQVRSLRLVPNFGKATSTRAPGFIAKYGQLFQIEVEAIAPNVLEALVTAAITDPAIFDEKRWKRSLAAERRDVKRLQKP